MEIFSMHLELLTGKIKQVKKQIEKIERNRRNGIQQSSATSTPKTANNREIRHKQELSHSLNLGTQKSTNTKTSNSDTAVESVDTENSDCELVEQPPDLIILDEDSQSSSSGSTSLENSSSSENSNESTHLEQENSTIESEKFVDSDSSTLFYEDREPSLDYTGPLYDSVPCVVIDSSNEAADATPAAEPNDMSSATLSIGVMPKLFTIRNENYDQNRESQKIVGDTATDLTTPKSISLDTPSVPTMNMRISVQPTEREVSTRTCTITSSAAKCPETINSSGREVLRAKPSASNVEAPFQPKPFQITIKNECAPSTSVAVAADCEKDDASASNILKRCREDSDVILVDESTSDSRQDDSVIFVSESMNTERPLVPRPGKRKGGPLITFGSDYIPVAGRDQESPPAKLGRTKSTRAQRKKVKKIDRRQALIAECRKQQTSTSIVTQPVSAAINNNDDEKRAAVDPNQLQKRMIIIDGSNVAFGHGGHGQDFSVRGIELCLDYFITRGFVAKAVVPQMRLLPFKSTNPQRMIELAKTDKLLLTPCKNLQGRKIMCYDDRIMLDIAVASDAAIISNDNYNDLAAKKPEWDELIRTRVVGFTWFNDMFILPDDPYGREGPNLNQILHKPKVYDANESKLENYGTYPE